MVAGSQGQALRGYERPTDADAVVRLPLRPDLGAKGARMLCYGTLPKYQNR